MSPPRSLPYVDPMTSRGPLHRLLVGLASSRLVGRLSKTAVWRSTVWKVDPHLLRLSGGRLSTGLGLPTALLETRGARTGRARRNGVIYFHDGERVTIIASQAGYPRNPAWFHNARANPGVLLGGQPFEAHVVDDEAARARLWELADRVFPAFARYRTEAGRHGRTIPILQLVPRGAPATMSEILPRMTAITPRETRQIEQANASGKTPVVFIHGLWLLPSSWDNWAGLFEEAGYAALTPSWPDDPETVEEARANPDVLAKKTLKQIADHTAEVIGKLDKKPAVMGHSTGGLLTYMIADRGLSAASVAIDPGPFRGVLPLPISALRSAGPVLKNPLNRGRAVTLTLDQFKYGWANALTDEEAKQLYETYHVAAPGVALMQMANANVNPFTEAKVDPKNPERGPLLIIDGEKDHTVPWAIANGAYKKQKHNQAVTEIVMIPNRGHSLTIDSGWREVAETALGFVKRFT